MSFQCWLYGLSKSLVVNESNEPISFHGNITIESFNAPANNYYHTDATKICSGNPIFFVGGIEGITWYNFGSLQLTNAYNMTGPSTGNLRRVNLLPKTNTVPLTTGTNVTEIASGDILSTLLVKLTINAPNYIYSATLLATHDGYGNMGSVNVLAVHRAFNGTGWGDPTFSVDVAGSLIIYNPNYPQNGVSCTYNAIPLYDGVN